MKKIFLYLIITMFFLPMVALAEDYSDVGNFKELFNLFQENDVPGNVCIWHAEGDNAIPGLDTIILFYTSNGFYVQTEHKDEKSENYILYDASEDKKSNISYSPNGSVQIFWDMLLPSQDFVNFWMTTKTSCPDTIQLVDHGGTSGYYVRTTESLTDNDMAYPYSRKLNNTGSESNDENSSGSSCHVSGADNCSPVCYKKTKNYKKEIWFEIGYVGELKYLTVSMDSSFATRTSKFMEDKQILLDINQESYLITEEAMNVLFTDDGKFLECSDIAIGETKNGTGTVFWIGTDDTILGDDKDHAQTAPGEEEEEENESGTKDEGEKPCRFLWGDPDEPNDPAYWVQWALDLIKYAAIIALLLFSTIDFVKAFVSQDRDAINKALITAAKRAIFAVMIFFLPILVELIMTLFSAYGTCGFE